MTHHTVGQLSSPAMTAMAPEHPDHPFSAVADAVRAMAG
ncbi:MAG: hypothetical protein JWQ20_3849 [Conexibacter sp.]|nr:hypothetical protein [Conexibacter sp.]